MITENRNYESVGYNLFDNLDYTSNNAKLVCVI